MLWIALEPIATFAFPPCIKNIIHKSAGERGRHRTGAILASFLGQAGWSESGAKFLWSNSVSAEERIFTEWFGKMHCPKCETMKRQSRGYPDLGVADLGLCQPDEKCREFAGPVEYAADLVAEEDKSKGRQLHIRTICRARVFDWTTGKVGEIELSPDEKAELEDLQKKQAEKENGDEMLFYTCARVRGRLRPRFFLKKAEGPRRRMLSELL